MYVVFDRKYSVPKLFNRIMNISFLGPGPGPGGHEGLARPWRDNRRVHKRTKGKFILWFFDSPGNNRMLCKKIYLKCLFVWRRFWGTSRSNNAEFGCPFAKWKDMDPKHSNILEKFVTRLVKWRFRMTHPSCKNYTLCSRTLRLFVFNKTLALDSIIDWTLLSLRAPLGVLESSLSRNVQIMRTEYKLVLNIIHYSD